MSLGLIPGFASLSVLAAILVAGAGWARAEEGGEAAIEGGSSGASLRKGKARSTRRKGRRVGEKKEAEGTQALNRFEADTIHKSQYKLNGEQLEVDPD